MWPFKSKLQRAKERRQRGYDYVISELKKGTSREVLENQADNPFDKSDFDYGMRDALIDCGYEYDIEYQHGYNFVIRKLQEGADMDTVKYCVRNSTNFHYNLFDKGMEAAIKDSKFGVLMP